MPKVRFSIITVCFNAAETIERTIQSVMAQADADIEYIIVDGASTDGTLQIVKRYSARISKMVSEKDGGIFDAMNKGIDLASGDVIYFLNADDYFVDERILHDVAQAFEAKEGVAFVYGNVSLKDEPGGALSFPARAFAKHSISEFLHNSFCHQAVFVRRSLFAVLGKFDRQYKYSADYEWIIRAFKRKSGEDFQFIERNIAYYSCLGRSSQHAAITQKEVNRMQFKHFFSLEYVWYFFRYVFVRQLRKRLTDPAR